MANNAKTENETMEYEYEAGRCQLHDARMNTLEKEVDELTNETIKGNGRPSLKARMDMVEKYISQQIKLSDEKRAENRKIKILVVGAWITLIITQVGLKLFGWYY